MSVVLGLVLEHSCPWPRKSLYSGKAVLGLGFALCPWPLANVPFLDLGLVEGLVGYRMHSNPDLGPRRKVKWEKTENFPEMADFAKN